jgi:hypothetical protein
VNSSSLRIGLILTGLLVAPLAAAESAPSPSAPYTPKQSDRPEPVEGEEPGFQSIFDGQTLDGWAGDPTYWRVEDGAIVGEITPATVLRSNTFIIWQGGQPADFELKLEYRISAEGNSGINYRSVLVPDPVTPANAFALRGYQCDLDGRHQYTGNNYEEKGRLFLALRGQLTRVVGGRPPVLLATMADPTDALTDDGGWHTVHLIARGSTLMHSINGRLMSVVIDDDAPHRPAAGKIGVQVHVGPPMKVEFRRLRLKTFDP